MVLEIFRQWLVGLQWDTIFKSIISVLFTVLGVGCAFIKPTTSFEGPGWSFMDTKDNDIIMDRPSFTKDGQSASFNAERISVANKSSSVIEANVQQMLAFVEQQKAANEGIKAAMSGLAQIVKEVIPFLNLTQGTAAAFLNQLATIEAQVKLSDLATIEMGKKLQPATQPAQ